MLCKVMVRACQPAKHTTFDRIIVLARQQKKSQLIGFTRLVHNIAINWKRISNKTQDFQISCILFVLCHKMPVSTTGDLFFPLLIKEQHNLLYFWNRLPKKSQDLSTYRISHCFMSQNACFSFPNFGTAHYFQRIND